MKPKSLPAELLPVFDEALRLHQEGEYLQALNIFMELAKEYPDDPDVLYNVACCRARIGQRCLDSATDALAAAIEHNPQSYFDALKDSDLQILLEKNEIAKIRPETPESMASKASIAMIATAVGCILLLTLIFSFL